jgi:hypothetical protein
MGEGEGPKRSCEHIGCALYPRLDAAGAAVLVSIKLPARVQGSDGDEYPQ